MLSEVEALAAQIQDRPEATRTEQKRMLDDRGQFLYEKFFDGHDASQVREFTHRRIDAEGLKWPKITSKTDVRAIADQ